MFYKLWADEGGAVLSAELILIMTILVIGSIVGLKTLQTAIVTELADVAAAVSALDQSFSFSGSQAGSTNQGVTGLQGTTTLVSTPGSTFVGPQSGGNTVVPTTTGLPGLAMADVPPVPGADALGVVVASVPPATSGVIR